MPVAATSHRMGLPMTVAVILSHMPPILSTLSRAALRRTRPLLMRSPISEMTAGSSVIDAPMASSTTMIAPRPRLRKIVLGTNSIPSSASTTVRPLKNTARLAVAPVRPMASSLSKPRTRSSR